MKDNRHIVEYILSCSNNFSFPFFHFENFYQTIVNLEFVKIVLYSGILFSPYFHGASIIKGKEDIS